LRTDEPFNGAKVLARVDALAAEAGALWQGGRQLESLEKAQEASLLYMALCGPDHPPLVELSKALVAAVSADHNLAAQLARTQSPAQLEARAKALLGEAGSLWQSGRREWSYLKARMALIISQSALGEANPGVVTLKGMVDGAGAALGLEPGAPRISPAPVRPAPPAEAAESPAPPSETAAANPVPQPPDGALAE
jgi:hypothetical protein